MAQGQANFHFFLGRSGQASAGIRASELADPYGMRQGLIPTLVVGPQLRARNDKPVRWARVIPPGTNDLPQISKLRGGEGDRILRGSIVIEQVDGKDRSFLVSHRDEKAYYVLVRTGLMSRDGSVLADRLKLQQEGPLVTHGSYSFDHASVRVATAENEAGLSELLQNPASGVGRVAAERLRYKAIGKSIDLGSGVRCSQTAYVLWRMPFGAVLLIREIDGKLTRLVAQKDQLRVVDATGYATFFDQLEAAFVESRRKTKVSAGESEASEVSEASSAT